MVLSESPPIFTAPPPPAKAKRQPFEGYFVVRGADGQEKRLPIRDAIAAAAKPAKGESDQVRYLRLVLGQLGFVRKAKVEQDKRDPVVIESEIRAAIEDDPKNPEHWQRLIRHQAANHADKVDTDNTGKAMKAHGIDPKVIDALDILDQAARCDSMRELTDEECDHLEEVRNGVLAGCETDADVKKKWRRTVSRIQSLRKWARQCLPAYILYVGQTQIGRSRLKNTNFPDATKRLGMLMTTDVHLLMDTTIMFADNGLIEAPPRHGKSQRAQLAVGYWVGNDHDLRICYVTGTEENARKRRNYVYQIFDPETAMGRRHRALFPDCRLDWSRPGLQVGLSFQVERKSAAVQPTFKACSFEESVEGVGYDIGLFDDILSVRDRQEQRTREDNCWRLGSVWLQRFDPGAKKLVLGYPQHEDDAVQQLRKDPAWKCRIMPVGDDFTPLIPEVRSREWLMAEHAARPGNFAQQYWLRATSDADAIVNRLRYYDQEDAELSDLLAGIEKPTGGESMVVYLTVDPSGSEKATADYTAIVRCVYFRNRLHVTDAWRQRLTPAENESQLIARACDPNVGMNFMLVEGVSGYAYLFKGLESALGPSRVIKAISPWKSKATRLRNVAGILESGRVLFKGQKIADHWEPAADIAWLTAEILNFREEGISKDDGMDAVVQLVHHLEDELLDLPEPDERPDGLTERQRAIQEYERRCLAPPVEDEEDDLDVVGFKVAS